MEVEQVDERPVQVSPADPEKAILVCVSAERLRLVVSSAYSEGYDDALASDPEGSDQADDWAVSGTAKSLDELISEAS